MKRSPRYLLWWIVFITLSLFSFSYQIERNNQERIDKLIKILETRHWEMAVEELAKIGEPALPSLLEALHGNIEWIAARSCYALTKIGTPEAVRAVSDVLRDEEIPVRIRQYHRRYPLWS